MNEAIKKANMHYVGFIDTCTQMGIEKDAADRLYKEALGELGRALSITGALSKAKPGTVRNVTRLVVPTNAKRLGSGLATTGALSGPGITPVPRPTATPPAAAIRPPVRQAPPGSFAEFENRFSYIKDPVAKRRYAAFEWGRLHDQTKAKALATMPTSTAPTAGEINKALAARAGATVDLEAARAAGAQLTPGQQQLLARISDPAKKAALEAQFLKINAFRKPLRVEGVARQDLGKAVGGPERLLKAQTAKLRGSLRSGTAGTGNAAADLEGAADTMPAAGSYLPWLALGGGVGAGLVGYGLVSNRSAA